MSKKSCVRTPFESQHPNGSKTLFKSERQYFYQIFSALWEKWSWKMSLSVIYELLGLFVNTFTVNDKNFLCNSENLRQRIQMQLSKNPRSFIKFLLHLWILQSEFKYFIKKVTLIAGVIPKSQTVEAVVTQMSKKSRFRAPCDSQHVNGSQTHVKSSWQHCYHNFSSVWAKVTWKMSLLVIFEILGLFVNTLTTNDKYSFRNSELLP